jgi:hypothetical protein
LTRLHAGSSFTAPARLPTCSPKGLHVGTKYTAVLLKDPTGSLDVSTSVSDHTYGGINDIDKATFEQLTNHSTTYSKNLPQRMAGPSPLHGDSDEALPAVGSRLLPGREADEEQERAESRQDERVGALVVVRRACERAIAAAAASGAGRASVDGAGRVDGARCVVVRDAGVFADAGVDDGRPRDDVDGVSHLHHGIGEVRIASGHRRIERAGDVSCGEDRVVTGDDRVAYVDRTGERRSLSLVSRET